MNTQGRDVINLGIGSPDLAPSPETIQVAMEYLQKPGSHGYASYRGLPELRDALAAWYAKVYGVTVKPATEVLPLLGSKEGLFYISMAFLNPGDEVLVPNPGYPAYAAVTKLAGAKPVTYDLSESSHWEPDFAALEKIDLQKVKLFWVNYPNMPTGHAAGTDVFEKLVAFGRKHGILICHDNPYGLVLNQSPPRSLLQFDPKMEVSLELNSFSKAFNMAGWRVGVVLANQSVIETILRVKSNVDSGMFLPVQKAAIQALQNSEAWHQQRNEIYGRRQKLAFQLFHKLGFKAEPHQEGLFVWAKAPAEVTNVEAHVDEILEKSAVFITPGFIFGSNGERYARCSLCAPESKFSEALARLEKSL
jgi:aspartate/methionine/tyrosine aminotransferase